MKQIEMNLDNENFKGKIVIDIPSARQRLKYVKYCNFESDSEGNITSTNNIDAMEKVYEIAAKHVSKVDVKHSSGIKFKNFDQMADDSDCDELCQNLIKVVLEGKLGND